MDKFARTGEAFDIYCWFELFTMDVLGELALGAPFGVLEAGQPARYSKLVGQYNVIESRIVSELH